MDLAAVKQPATWALGDATGPDGSFEVVLSADGAMPTPDGRRAAGELVRVCRPCGRIGMVSWTPDSYLGELLAAVGRHLPRLGGRHAGPAAGLPGSRHPQAGVAVA